MGVDEFGRSGGAVDHSLGSTARLDHAPSVTNAASIMRRLADALEAGANASSLFFPNEQVNSGENIQGGAESRRLLAWARTALKVREQRAKFFPATEIFGEPCWDMILDLFVASLTGRAISVTSACVASRVPATTALRWLTVLEKEKIVERVADSKDGRRVYVSLTEYGFNATKDLISSLSG